MHMEEIRQNNQEGPASITQGQTLAQENVQMDQKSLAPISASPGQALTLEKKSSWSRQKWGEFFVFLLFLAMDLGSKAYFAHNFVLGEDHPVIPGFFSLRYITNSGAAWGFLSDKTWGIIVLSGISVTCFIILLYLTYQSHQPWVGRILALMSAGTAGNMVERLFYGEVVDFLSFTFGSYNFPVFNLADTWISLAVFFLALILLFAPQLLETNFPAWLSEAHPHTTDGKDAPDDGR